MIIRKSMFLGGEYTSFPAKQFASFWNTLIAVADKRCGGHDGCKADRSRMYRFINS